jgi:hypothetical protein
MRLTIKLQWATARAGEELWGEHYGKATPKQALEVPVSVTVQLVRTGNAAAELSLDPLGSI